MNQAERKEIVELIRREVIPAIGCTEPMAVALATSRATELLGRLPERIEVRLSPNILKNAMGVGIPGTGMIGLPVAVSLGALVGRSAYGLEVIKETKPADVEQAKEYIAQNRIGITLKKDITERLYVEVEVTGGGESAKAVIAASHTNFVYLSHNDKVLLDCYISGSDERCAKEVALTMRRVYDFATTAPVDEISFILEARRLNKAAAEESLNGEWGHCLGRTLQSATERRIMGDSTFSRILSYTSAACDARMGGAMIPVMSNSGSGNQGIAATLPVVVYAEDNACTEEQTARALVLSHLTVIYIKQSLGRLSALCGCVVAATGSSCGITYLMGGGYDEVSMAVKNMVANLTGVICDGAKPSCALKLTSGVSTAVMSAVMAVEHRCVSSQEGIVDDDVDRCILNLTEIGSRGMCETDRMILDIMTSKQKN